MQSASPIAYQSNTGNGDIERGNGDGGSGGEGRNPLCPNFCLEDDSILCKKITAQGRGGGTSWFGYFRFGGVFARSNSQ